MKLIIPSVFAALVSSASANCETAAQLAAAKIMRDHKCSRYPNTGRRSGNRPTCSNGSLVKRRCREFIDEEFNTRCANLPSWKKWDLMDECEYAEVLQIEESGAEEEVIFSEDSGDNEDEDAPPVSAFSTYLRGKCGKITSAFAAEDIAVNIVNDMWRSKGERCGYATSVFERDAKRALLNEFPDNCHTEIDIGVNQVARDAGDNRINQIVSSCSRPVPRPSGRPRAPTGCSSRDYDGGVRMTERLRVTCGSLDRDYLKIQQELAVSRANDCVWKGAIDKFDEIKRYCRNEEKSVKGYINKSGKNGKDLEIE